MLGIVGIIAFLTVLGLSLFITRLYRLLWVIGGVAILPAAGKSNLVDQTLSRAIKWALKRWTTLEVHDYTNLMNLSGEYTVTEIYSDDRLVIYGRLKTLQELEQRRADRSADQAHSDSVCEQKWYRAEQERNESVHKRRRERR